MVCKVHLTQKPEFHNPVLIVGLPGIGFVANISVLHLIHELDAKLFGEITSSSFQDLAVTTAGGISLSPTSQLYYYQGDGGERDLIIWYGNTQALTTFGQYELCGRVLDTVQDLGCQYAVTVGGFKIEEEKREPQIYCAASDSESLQEALDLDTKTMVGQIFGVAGITVGLAQLRNLKAFSLLVETTGTEPDAEAARRALTALSEFLNLNVNVSNLERATEETHEMLESFGIIRRKVKKEKEKERENSQFRWYI
ncbi:MAG: PAC2 family protein [Thermoproteota archaeon]